MGTNYYAIVDNERLHIGKSSAGWCFSLHVEPDRTDHPADWTEWKAFIARPDVLIEDEYGASIDVATMISVVEQRSFPYKHDSKFDYAANHALPGPKNLVRHALSDRCLAHGVGTWDLIRGEFS